MGFGGQRHPSAALPRESPGTIVLETGWASGSFWTGAENLTTPTGIRHPNRPACSELLYRLSYPGL